MLDSLNKITSMYTDQYLTVESSQGIYMEQKEKLAYIVNDMQKKINAKNDIIATYDRELQDRNAVSRPYTFWRVRGVSTLQDWVLFSFFVVYGLVTLFLAGLSLRSEFPLYSISIVLLSSFSLAVVIMASIVRFA
jgi:hypothetical protein